MTMPKCDCKAHHVALSVRDLSRSLEFYANFGFEERYRWTAPDDSLAIVHAKLGDFVLELFGHRSNQSEQPLDLAVANNLDQLGVKHLGLRVPDLAKARQALESDPTFVLSETKRGRTEIDYFFVRDPDGLWLEVVQDDRNL